VARSINITDPLVTNVPTAPEYWVIDAMLAYEVNDQVTLQLNAYNLADEEYVATLNNGGSRYIPGAPLSALFTVNFSF
jgi:catecholate siderophore receptor